jgi:MoaA/NifB/PqqE/SkfB family radical SAM enzyme
MFLPFKIIGYNLSREIGLSRLLPINLTVSVTFRCNSRCKTCNIYKKKSQELNIEEFDKIFKSIGRDKVFWITFSGGEVFLRNDFSDICNSAYQHCRPKIITIPTNGLLYEIILKEIRKILKICSKSKIIVNLSLDDIEEKHDFIRGTEDNFKKALKTYYSLQSLKLPNLVLGVHTVISKFNVKRIPEIYNFVMNELKPDSYITEIAEEREELGTVGYDIIPLSEDYFQAVDFLINKIRKNKFKGLSKLTEAFRINYYDMVKQILKDKKQIISCYAGFASGHIAPNGDVWACCIRAEKMGNLRERNYDFKKVWFDSKAREIRKKIKSRNCFCPLANVSYTNILCNLKSFLKIFIELLK